MGAKVWSFEQSSLTSMSGGKSAHACLASLVTYLVRSSHSGLGIVVLAMATVGCIYQDPPGWEAPKKTRPQLSDPVPSPLQIIPVTNASVDPSQGPASFAIRVIEHSEDNGDGIRAITFINYTGNTKDPNSEVEFQNIREFDPSTYDVEKDLNIEWRVPAGSAECIPLTLIVTHASNVDESLNHFPIDNSDVASITWWLSVNNPGKAEINCPVVTSSANTGGSS
jgi:hypothetical protein